MADLFRKSALDTMATPEQLDKHSVFSLTDLSHNGVAITPGFTDTTLIFFLFSIKNELNSISRHLLEAQYGEMNGKIP